VRQGLERDSLAGAGGAGDEAVPVCKSGQQLQLGLVTLRYEDGRYHRKIIAMAGHSKWANIKHRKAAADAKKGKIFTRLIKEITVASRLGGSDPDSNPRLRLAMDKAREANMAKDSVQNAIKRGAGQLDGVSYEEVRYEGYGVGGAAVLLDCLTDNRTRTVAEVRHAFTKNGGNLGSDGSVGYLFKHCGQFIFAPGTSEDKVMEAGLDAGAEDVTKNDDGSVELICAPPDFDAVKAALEKSGLKAELAEITMKPTNESTLSGEDGERMRRLLDALENLDDVQDVYTTAVID
jgi:YebC/PmpR family DNA-binding regulatory protein